MEFGVLKTLNSKTYIVLQTLNSKLKILFFHNSLLKNYFKN